MFKFISSVVFLLSLSFYTHAQENLPASTRVLFLSCIDQDYAQPLWKELHEAKGDAVLLIGDNVYANSGEPEILKMEYDRLSAQPIFQTIKKETLVSGTWDDHDYGLNDGGREFEGKKAAQKAFLDFFDVAEDSPRRQQEGIYHSFMLGEEGQRVQLIMLDTRYFRSPLNKMSKLLYLLYRYAPSEAEEQDMLGDAQWQWLEQELKKPAEVRIIASSIQFIADNNGFERWQTLPKEKQRMLNLLQKTQANGVMFISGDRHVSELMKTESAENALTYPLLDLTSSSFNKSVPYSPSLPSDKKIGKTINEDNFGSITVNWTTRKIELALIGEAGEKLLQHNTSLKALGLVKNP